MKCAQSCEELLHLLGRDPELLVSNHTGSKAQELTGQSLGRGGFTLFPSSRFCPKGFSLVRFLMRKLFMVPSLTQDLLELSLRGSVELKRRMELVHK